MTDLQRIDQRIAEATEKEDHHSALLQAAEYDTADYQTAARQTYYFMGIKHGLLDARLVLITGDHRG